MIKETVEYPDHAAEEPVSPLLRICDFLYMSAQLPLDPATGRMTEGDVRAQTEQCLKNMQTLLKEASLDLSYVLKTTVYLTDLENIKAVDDVYRTYFEAPYPARTVVQAAALPYGAAVQIECHAMDCRSLEVLCAEEEGCCNGCCCS